MTASPKKTTQLTAEEWKQLALLNASQLMNFLQGIPGNTESGSAGLTEQHMLLIGGHLDRMASFLRAWSVARVEVPPAQVEVPAEPPVAEAAKKGGWPKGKSRKVKEAVAA